MEFKLNHKRLISKRKYNQLFFPFNYNFRTQLVRFIIPTKVIWWIKFSGISRNRIYCNLKFQKLSYFSEETFLKSNIFTIVLKFFYALLQFIFNPNRLVFVLIQRTSVGLIIFHAIMIAVIETSQKHTNF